MTVRAGNRHPIQSSGFNEFIKFVVILIKLKVIQILQSV